MPGRRSIALAVVGLVASVGVIALLRDPDGQSGDTAPSRVQPIHPTTTVPHNVSASGLEPYIHDLQILSQGSPAHVPVDARSVDEAGDGRPAAAVESVAHVPHLRRGDNLMRFYVADEFFEDWYGEATDDELLLLKAKLEQRLWRHMDDAADLWFDMGLADTDETFHRDERPLADPADAAEPDGSGNHGLFIAIRGEDLGGGVHHQQSALLPWDAHQGLYNLQDEVNWLSRESRRRLEAER